MTFTQFTQRQVPSAIIAVFSALAACLTSLNVWQSAPQLRSDGQQRSNAAPFISERGNPERGSQPSVTLAYPFTSTLFSSGARCAARSRLCACTPAQTTSRPARPQDTRHQYKIPVLPYLCKPLGHLSFLTRLWQGLCCLSAPGRPHPCIPALSARRLGPPR